MKAVYRCSIALLAGVVAAAGCQDCAAHGDPPIRACTIPTCVEQVFLRSFGDATHIVAPESVVATPKGSTCVTGSFTGTLDVGAGMSLMSRAPDVFDGFLFCLDEKGQPLFLRSLGDGVNKQFPYFLASFGDSDLLLTGMVSGTVDFGEGPVTTDGADVVVARLDEVGRARWVRIFGNESPRQMGLVSVIAADGTSIVAGQAEGSLDFGQGPLAAVGDMDVFVLALGPDGSTRWGKMGGGPQRDQVNAVALSAEGQVAIVGEHPGSLTLGGQSLEAPANVAQGYLLVLDLEGHALLGKAFRAGAAGDGHSSVEGVGFDQHGRIIVAGYFEGEMDLDGVRLTSAPRKEAGFWARLGKDGKAEAARALGVRVVRAQVLRDGRAWLSSYDNDKDTPTHIGDVPVPAGAGLVLLSSTGAHLDGLWYGRANPNALFANEQGIAVAGDLSGRVSFGGDSVKPAGKAQGGFVVRLK